MTPASTTRLRALGLTAEGFARLTRTSPVTVSYWGRQRPDRRGVTMPPEPAWVSLLLDAWERSGVPQQEAAD